VVVPVPFNKPERVSRELRWLGLDEQSVPELDRGIGDECNPPLFLESGILPYIRSRKDQRFEPGVWEGCCYRGGVEPFKQVIPPVP